MGIFVFIFQRANRLHQTEIRARFPTSFSPVLHWSKMILRMCFVMGQSRLNRQNKSIYATSPCSLCIPLFFLLIHPLRTLTITEKQTETHRHISNEIKKINTFNTFKDLEGVYFEQSLSFKIAWHCLVHKVTQFRINMKITVVVL